MRQVSLHAPFSLVGETFSSRPSFTANLHTLADRALPPGSYEQQLFAQYAQGQLTLVQVEAELEQLAIDWECVYTG